MKRIMLPNDSSMYDRDNVTVRMMTMFVQKMMRMMRKKKTKVLWLYEISNSLHTVSCPNVFASHRCHFLNGCPCCCVKTVLFRTTIMNNRFALSAHCIQKHITANDVHLFLL